MLIDVPTDRGPQNGNKDKAIRGGCHAICVHHMVKFLGTNMAVVGTIEIIWLSVVVSLSTRRREPHRPSKGHIRLGPLGTGPIMRALQ